MAQRGAKLGCVGSVLGPCAAKQGLCWATVRHVEGRLTTVASMLGPSWSRVGRYRRHVAACGRYLGLSLVLGRGWAAGML